MSKKCNACNAENDDKAKFCRGCGAALVAATHETVPSANEQKICPSCHIPNKLSAKFCLGCGYKFVDANAPASSPLARPQPSVSPPAAPPVVASTGPTVVAPTPPPSPPSPPQPRAAPATTPVVEFVSAKPPIRPAVIEKPLVATSDRITPAPLPVPARESIPWPTETAASEESTRHGMKLTLIIAGVLLISLLSGGGYWYFGRSKANLEGPAVVTTPIQPATNAAPTLPTVPTADPVKTPEAPGPSTQAPLANGDVPNAAQPLPGTTQPIDQAPANLAPIVKPAIDTTPNVPKAPTKPREVRPKIVAEPIAKPPGSTADSKKSAEDLRKQIEDELKGVVRKN